MAKPESTQHKHAEHTCDIPNVRPEDQQCTTEQSDGGEAGADEQLPIDGAARKASRTGKTDKH